MTTNPYPSYKRLRIPGLIDSHALAGFVPSSLSSCVGWFDVSYETGWNDADLVNLWTDRVAVNGNATGSGGTRPTYKTNIVNGRPILRFSGNHYLSLTALKDYSAATWFFVLSRESTGNSDYMLGNGGTYSYLQYASTWYSSNGVNKILVFSSGIFMLKCVKYDGVNHTYYTNGSSNGQNTSAAALVYKDIGASGYQLNADIAEVVLCNAALSDSQRIQVETYLNTKYVLW